MKTGLFIILACLFGLVVVVYSTEPPQEKPNIDNHYYDYLLEVHGDDSIPTYDLFDSKHDVVVYNIKASQLDSVIISDNQ